MAVPSCNGAGNGADWDRLAEKSAPSQASGCLSSRCGMGNGRISPLGEFVSGTSPWREAWRIAIPAFKPIPTALLESSRLTA